MQGDCDTATRTSSPTRLDAGEPVVVVVVVAGVLGDAARARARRSHSKRVPAMPSMGMGMGCGWACHEMSSGECAAPVELGVAEEGDVTEDVETGAPDGHTTVNVDDAATGDTPIKMRPAVSADNDHWW